MLIQQSQEGLLRYFKASYKSKDTAIKAAYLLNFYAKKDIASLLSLTQKEAEDKLIDFIITEKEAGRSWGNLHNYVAAVAKFYLINDIQLNMAKVKRFMPEHTKLKKDRAYTVEEIQTLLEMANERTRTIILLLSSSGMRLGGLANLQLCDLESIGDIYKITVYRNTKDEYFTYCTPEARKALDRYLEVRKRHGEKFTDEKINPVIREQYNREILGNARLPKFSTRAAISKAIEDLLLRAGLRQKQHKTEEKTIFKKDISLCHGFRKFFNTQLANAEINPLIKELLMGHEVGLEENYYRPTENKIREEYESAIEALTISPENKLRRENTKLKDENKTYDRLAAEIADLKLKMEIKK